MDLFPTSDLKINFRRFQGILNHCDSTYNRNLRVHTYYIVQYTLNLLLIMTLVFLNFFPLISLYFSQSSDHFGKFEVKLPGSSPSLIIKMSVLDSLRSIPTVEKNFCCKMKRISIYIRCGRVMADNIAYAKFRKNLLI